MTRPKWIRKQKKVIEKANEVARRALRDGGINLRSESGKRVRISFVTPEKEIDVEKFSKYFGTLIGTIKSVYREAGKEPKKKASKYFINGNVDEVIGNMLIVVYEKWKEYGHETDL